MNGKGWLFGLLLFASACMLSVSWCLAAEPIVLGVPTSLGFLEGKEGLLCINMAVDEINNKGGVNVGGVKRPFQVVSIDARGAEPGVPVADVCNYFHCHKR